MMNNKHSNLLIKSSSRMSRRGWGLFSRSSPQFQRHRQASVSEQDALTLAGHIRPSATRRKEVQVGDPVRQGPLLQETAHYKYQGPHCAGAFQNLVYAVTIVVMVLPLRNRNTAQPPFEAARPCNSDASLYLSLCPIQIFGYSVEICC